ELAAAEEVDVEPPDGLLSIGALVDDQSVAIVAQPLLAGHLSSHEHEVAHERFLVLLHVSDSCMKQRLSPNCELTINALHTDRGGTADGLLGDDEDVSGRLGRDV